MGALLNLKKKKKKKSLLGYIWDKAQLYLFQNINIKKNQMLNLKPNSKISCLFFFFFFFFFLF